MPIPKDLPKANCAWHRNSWAHLNFDSSSTTSRPSSSPHCILTSRHNVLRGFCLRGRSSEFHAVVFCFRIVRREALRTSDLAKVLQFGSRSTVGCNGRRFCCTLVFYLCCAVRLCKWRSLLFSIPRGHLWWPHLLANRLR